MRLGVLFSGGKDSTLAAFLARKEGHEISCLISMISGNGESFMFHVPSVSLTKFQAREMGIPIIMKNTDGKKEEELKDMEDAIREAKTKFKIEGIVTGAVESVYQALRIQRTCDKLSLECFNPIWQKEQVELLRALIRNKFRVIITGVSAYPLGKEWLGREINKDFIRQVKKLNEKHEISPAGEGGEFETLVLDCPLFRREIRIKGMEIRGGKNSWSAEIET